MSSTKEDRTDLSREEAEFVERLAANFAPAPMSPSRRVAFDEALWARLGRRGGRTILIPAFATVAVAAVVALLIFTGRFEPVATDGGVEPGAIVAEASAAAQWEVELLYLRELTPPEERDDSELLPDDYLAIASVFLSG